MICWACAEPYEGDKCSQCGADKVKPYVKEEPKRKVKEDKTPFGKT